MSNIYSIYKITNTVNGRVYVGLSHSPLSRIKKHLNCETGCIKLHRAIKKYGKKCFIGDIIENNLESFELAAEREIFYIELYNSFLCGYNSTTGGEGIPGHKHSTETKLKMSEKASNRKVSDKQREKFRIQALKGSEGYNKRYTSETRRKLSESQKERISNGYNPKATMWVVQTPSSIIKFNNPTLYCRNNKISFKTLWLSHKNNMPIKRGNLKGWKLIDIIKI